MTQVLEAQTPDAATDPRIDPQIRAFLADLNKDSSPFWELPQPKPQEILTGLQNKTPIDMSGATLPIKESDRKYLWPLGRRPDYHPGLSDLGL